MNYRTVLKTDDEEFAALADILPGKSLKTNILFIGKTPTPLSVQIGHYFQGRQGKMFWKKLQDYDILNVKEGTFEDENLIDHNFGITDIAKIPRPFGEEPTHEEYKKGITRILKIIEIYKAKVIVFVYKAVLDKILRLEYELPEKSTYGINAKFRALFNSEVFVFPMPGTPCTREMAHIHMTELIDVLKERGNLDNDNKYYCHE